MIALEVGVLKELSLTALSQQFPFRLMLQIMSWSESAS